MTRLPALALLSMLLGACAPDTSPVPDARAVEPAMPRHPAAMLAGTGAIRTAIGEVRALDARSGTVTVALVSGALREQTGFGPVRRLTATPAQQARLRVGDVIEFRYRSDHPYPRVTSVDRHIHAGPRGGNDVSVMH